MHSFSDSGPINFDILKSKLELRFSDTLLNTKTTLVTQNSSETQATNAAVACISDRKIGESSTLYRKVVVNDVITDSSLISLPLSGRIELEMSVTNTLIVDISEIAHSDRLKSDSEIPVMNAVVADYCYSIVQKQTGLKKNTIKSTRFKLHKHNFDMVSNLNVLSTNSAVDDTIQNQSCNEESECKETVKSYTYSYQILFSCLFFYF